MVATGLNFPDALAGGPAAAALRAPILLVAGTAVPAATTTEMERLAPRTAVVLGGTAAVAEGVADELALLLR
jgi:putative cell wall-binding protein